MALFSTVAVIDVLESIPEVTPDKIEAVMRELGMLLSITIDDMMPVLGRCGVRPRQGLRARGIVEKGPVASVGGVSPLVFLRVVVLLTHYYRTTCNVNTQAYAVVTSVLA
jgi:hypothetical protein